MEDIEPLKRPHSPDTSDIDELKRHESPILLSGRTEPEKTDFPDLRKNLIAKTPIQKWGNLPLASLDTFKITKGKQKGKTFREAVNDANYINWLLKNEVSTRSNIGLFKHYLIRCMEANRS